MPSNSITIVSPVSGETLLAGAVMSVSADYEYVYLTSRYVGGQCTTGTGHSSHAGPISGGTSDSIEVGLGTHSGTYTGVELTVRIQDTTAWNSPYVAQGSVNNITITDTPPVRIDRSNGLERLPYFRVGSEALTDADQKAQWPIDTGREFDPKADLARLDQEYDPAVDLKLTGTIGNASLFDGSIVGVVNGKLGKTGLVGVYTLKPADVTIDPATGKWEVTIPKKVLKKAKAPRQLILTLLDKNEEFVATVSAPLKKK
jgi:hypothetical protein